MKKNIVKIENIDNKTTVPVKMTSGASCFDLYATEDVSFEALTSFRVPTGIRLDIPEGWEGRIRGRSGMACKSFITHEGTLDNDFTGEIFVIMHTLKSGKIDKGDRIAQLAFNEVPEIELQVVDKVTKVTDRGEDGFGSTGR